tara:strand:+ start:2641 stop:2910 length:270 start_codon:yes stop_codon:yes gene_type:complete
MGLFGKKNQPTEEELNSAQFKSENKKAYRQRKKGFKKEGYDRKTAKRMTNEDNAEDIISMKHGGKIVKTSNKRTSHRGAKGKATRHEGY